MLAVVTENPGSAHPRDHLVRELSLLDASMLVVASVIGAGIFFTPGQVAELLPAPGWIMAAWTTGAILSLAGALANAELGAMFPRAGGDYVYLREAFHPVAGFLVGWLSFFAIYAGTVAALASALAEGLGERLGWGNGAILGCALGVTVATSAVNYVSVRWAARANNVTSALKILALVAFVALGPFTGAGDTARLWVVAEPGAITALNFGQALSPILFTYLGWNASVYVASEIRSPSRNVPRSLFLGLGICAGIYLAVNAVYLYALPMESLMGAADTGTAAGLALFGEWAGNWVGIFVLISVLGTLNATVLVGPRIAYAMSLDGLFPGGGDRVHSVFGTPSTAIVIQGLAAVVLLLVLRSFPAVLEFTVFAIVLATMADVLALYRLRAKQPDRPRPYRAWGYPWVPGLYLVANFAIAVAMLVGNPKECLISVGLLVAGLPFYFFFVAGRRAKGEDAQPRN